MIAGYRLSLMIAIIPLAAGPDLCMFPFRFQPMRQTQLVFVQRLALCNLDGLCPVVMLVSGKVCLPGPLGLQPCHNIPFTRHEPVTHARMKFTVYVLDNDAPNFLPVKWMAHSL